MAKGDQPTHRIIRKGQGEKEWQIIGAGWEREDGKISLSLELKRDEKVKAILVKNNSPRTSNNKAKDEDDSIPF